MVKFFDFSHPFYRPLWRRLLIVGLCVAWTLVEFAAGSPLWGLVFLAAAAISFYGLLVAFAPAGPDQKDNRK